MATMVREPTSADRSVERQSASLHAAPEPLVGRPARYTYLVDCLVLIGLCVLFFWRDLAPAPPDHRPFASGDFANQFYAFAAYEASRLHAGQLPLWNPYTYSGHPFLADVQSAIFYPFSLLTMLLTAPGGFSYTALQLEAVLHFPLAAIFTYLLARRLTGSRWGGLIAATIFTFSGYLTGYPPLQLAVLETQVWLPLVLLLLDVAAERVAGGAWWAAARWAVAAGLAFGVSLLAGHPQSAMLVFYAALAFGLYRLWPRPGQARAWFRPLGLMALFALAGVTLAAVQLVPSLQFMALSTRTTLGFDEAGGGFTPYDLLQIVIPAVGVPVPALYVGILPLGLAALGLLRGAPGRTPGGSPIRAGVETRPIVPFLGWGALLALLLSFGKITPVYTLFYLLAPGWSLFRQQERTIVWAILAVAVLAGFGAAWLTRSWSAEHRAEHGAGSRALFRAYIGAALAALAVALLCFIGYQSGRQELWGFTAATMFLALLAALSALVVRTRRGTLLLALVVFDLFTQVGGNHLGRAADAFPPQAVLAPALADSTVFRIANEDRLPGNYGDAYRLADTGGASPLRMASYQGLLDALPVARRWQLLNVKYVLTGRESIDAPAERVAQANLGGGDGDGKGRPTYLYQLTQPGPRAWLAGTVVEEADAGRVWARLADPAFDPARQVLMAARPDGYADVAACNGEVALGEWLPERLSLQATTAQPCLLVLAELHYPGWQATVDGAAVPILLADGALRSLVLPAGSHQVVFVFRPAIVSISAAISGLTLLGCLAWLLWSWRRGTNGREAAVQPSNQTNDERA